MRKIIEWIGTSIVTAIVFYAAWQFLFIGVYGILTGKIL